MKKGWLQQYKQGGMIKRADGSYSQRGLWDNIRANAGSGKKPTKEMLDQEKKIKANEKAQNGKNIPYDEYKEGGNVNKNSPYRRDIIDSAFNKYPGMYSIGTPEQFNIIPATGVDKKSLNQMNRGLEYFPPQDNWYPLYDDPKQKRNLPYNGTHRTLVDTTGLSSKQLEDAVTLDFLSHGMHKNSAYNQFTNDLDKKLRQQYGDKMVDTNGKVDAYIRGYISNSPEYEPYKKELQFLPKGYFNILDSILKTKPQFKEGGSVSKWDTPQGIISNAPSTGISVGETPANIPQHILTKKFQEAKNFNEKFRGARESGLKEFSYKGKKYNTDLVPKKYSDEYFNSKEFLKDYIENTPSSIDTSAIGQLNYDKFNKEYIKRSVPKSWLDAYDSVSKLPAYKNLSNEFGKMVKYLDDIALQQKLTEEKIKTFSPDYVSYLDSNIKKEKLKSLNDPSYFSITTQKPKDMEEDGYWNAGQNKIFIQANPENYTTYVHELAHKANQPFLNLASQNIPIPTPDMINKNRDAYNIHNNKSYQYLSNPSEVESRKMSALYAAKKKGIPVDENFVENLKRNRKTLPYDIGQLLDLYGPNENTLLYYLTNGKYGKKEFKQGGKINSWENEKGVITNAPSTGKGAYKYGIPEPTHAFENVDIKKKYPKLEAIREAMNVYNYLPEGYKQAEEIYRQTVPQVYSPTVGEQIDMINPIRAGINLYEGQDYYGNWRQGIPVLNAAGDIATLIPFVKELNPIINKAGKYATKTILKDIYKINPYAAKLNNPNAFYRIADEASLKDALESGVVRSKSSISSVNKEIKNLAERLNDRPTPFPSFAKGKPAFDYLPEEGIGYIYESKQPMLRRGDINPVTKQQIKGKHWAYRPFDLQTGKVLNNLPLDQVSIYSAEPHWLKGYQEIKKPLMGESNIGSQGVPKIHTDLYPKDGRYYPTTVITDPNVTIYGQPEPLVYFNPQKPPSKDAIRYIEEPLEPAVLPEPRAKGKAAIPIEELKPKRTERLQDIRDRQKNEFKEYQKWFKENRPGKKLSPEQNTIFDNNIANNPHDITFGDFEWGIDESGSKFKVPFENPNKAKFVKENKKASEKLKTANARIKNRFNIISGDRNRLQSEQANAWFNNQPFEPTYRINEKTGEKIYTEYPEIKIYSPEENYDVGDAIRNGIANQDYYNQQYQDIINRTDADILNEILPPVKVKDYSRGEKFLGYDNPKMLKALGITDRKAPSFENGPFRDFDKGDRVLTQADKKRVNPDDFEIDGIRYRKFVNRSKTKSGKTRSIPSYLRTEGENKSVGINKKEYEEAINKYKQSTNENLFLKPIKTTDLLNESFFIRKNKYGGTIKRNWLQNY